MKAFIEKNKNKIIGYSLWVMSCGLAFVSLSAMLSMATRLYGYFSAFEGSQKGFVFIQRAAILPVGITFLAVVRMGYEMVLKNAENRPDRMWNFYTMIFALEFAVLVLAAKL